MVTDVAYTRQFVRLLIFGSAILMSWIARARETGTRDAGRVISHTKPILYIGLAFSGFFLTLAIVSMFSAEARTDPWIPLEFFVFTALGLPMIAEYRNARHTLVNGGLCYGRMFGDGGALRWKDVASIRYSTAAKWFRITSNTGTVARISMLATGLPSFARAALAEVPATSLDDRSRAILEATAAGNPPSVWR